MMPRSGRNIQMPVERRYAMRLLLAIALSIGVAVFCPMIVAGIPAAVPLLIKWVFIPTGSMTPIATVIYTCLGDLVFCYLFSDFLEDGVAYSAVHVLPRSATRLGWFAKRMFMMVSYTVVYVVCTDGVMGCLGGLLISIDGIALVASAILLDVLMMLCLVVSTYLLSTLLNAISSYLVVACAHLVSLCLFTSLVPGEAGRAALAMPSAQGIYAIHGHIGPACASALQVDMIGLGYSYVYLAVLLLGLTYMVWMRFSKRDFL